MPQKKGCVPWNKGLTRKDKRVEKYCFSRKIEFSGSQKEEILRLYNDGLTVDKIGEVFGCSSHPISDYLNSIGARKSLSFWRRKISNENKEFVSEYYDDGRKLLVVDGFVNKKTGKLANSSKLELLCHDCGKSFNRTFSGYRSSLFYNNEVVCNKCSTKRRLVKFDRNGKISIQQRKISEITGAVLNYKISFIHVDMALEDVKVVIEYDGWTWHGDRNSQISDRKRDEFLKGLGWKVLRIKSRRLIPSKEEIFSKIEILKNGTSSYEEIVLEDWGVGYLAKGKI